jgi:fucose permease
VNKLGVKATLAFGGIGYCIYAISLLASEHAYVPGFNIFAGALLGVCAGLLWTAQGTIMISYPHEASKGRYFAWFWAIFNMGAVIGSLVRIISRFATVSPPTRHALQLRFFYFTRRIWLTFSDSARSEYPPEESRKCH